MAEKTICGKLAKFIGAEDEVQNEYDELADEMRRMMDSGKLPVSKASIDAIREIAGEERTHRKEFREVFGIVDCISKSLPDYLIR